MFQGEIVLIDFWVALLDYSIDTQLMGNQFCQQEESLTNNQNPNDGLASIITKQLPETAELGTFDEQLLEEGSTPLTNFITQHCKQRPICASNNLYFNVGTASKKSKEVREGWEGKREAMLETKQKMFKYNYTPKRCSIDHTNLLEFTSTIKDYLTTEKSVCQNFGRIQISQQKFIHLRNEDVKKYYKFQQIVGEGSFGSVYRALCLKTKQERAIKIIKKENLGQTKKAEVFAELQLLKKMDHPNIIKLFQVFETKERYQVVTEFCKGGSIIDFIKQRKHFDQNMVKIILKQLLGCINYLHKLHIVHRDIKLENIVFNTKLNQKSTGEQIEIKLLDFGTAYKLTRPKVKCNELVGTVSYMAPEIIRGFFTGKCDLWSCGVILYILLTSKSPFKCKKKEDTLEKILKHEIDYDCDLWNEVSANAKDLVKKLLEKDPFKRISADMALKHACFLNNSEKFHAKNTEFIKNLSLYYRENNLISVLESYLIFSKVSPEERKRINLLFKQLDRNNDGFIEKNELIQAYKEANSGETNLDQIEYILNKIDKDNSGSINLNEFSSAMVNREKLFVKDALEQAFDYFANGTGYIQMKELGKLLQGSDSKQIEKLLGQLDENRDKKISKEEFLHYLLKKGCLY